jgi:hypothetical protein
VTLVRRCPALVFGFSSLVPRCWRLDVESLTASVAGPGPTRALNDVQLRGTRNRSWTQFVRALWSERETDGGFETNNSAALIRYLS